MLQDKSVVLVVTGGIAAYKAAELARLLVKDGARVKVAMTGSATRFVTPLTFQTLTRNPVALDLWAMDRPYEVDHISLADWAEAVVIAPATADILAKMAMGLADDFVSTFLLAVRAPIVVCPSMNVHMYEHPAVQENMARLRARGVEVVDPAAGYLACGYEGKGRLPEPGDMAEEVRRALSPKDLAGVRTLVTSGPTREAWDDIRFMTNRSSGRMGVALARSAWRRGADVTLISGPASAAPPYGVETVSVESTLDMRTAVLDRLDRARVLVKAAAPGDFRPAERVKGKVKKGAEPPPIHLARNPDILAEVGRTKGDRILVGFAAEAENLIENARGKLEAKNLDLIVANQIGAPGVAFDVPTNQVSILDRQGGVETLPLMSKEDVADRIWDRIAVLLGRGPA
ncbi:MAG: bifunctional phosphopantothenoylcysteine decarboxylase/phosphopantothenate--cysteine ligase CoaBC [Proteobacteria bacterium]|nr:bifunctional phosphopantothenoylcysteine decarboxylase/phosphopantothenate--cysteine ligase CoaBC [Pseudomonadota bacterium]